MKQLLTIVLILSFNLSYSQITNKIGKVETLKIYGNSKVEIGQIIIIENTKYKLYLAGYESKRDSSGNYLTTYLFTNKENTTIYNVELDVEFNQPVIDANCKFMTGMISSGLNDSKTLYSATSNQILSKYFSISVISKAPLISKFRGVDGKLF